MKPAALTIAGSDPSGGAGIQADLKTFHQFGVYGMAAITLLTVQNTCAVTRVEVLDPRLVREQVRAVLEDIPPQAVKTGAIGSAENIECVAALADELEVPLVIDPVMISKHRAPLMAADASQSFIEKLLPKAYLITPNLHEAAALTGMQVESVDDMKAAAAKLVEMGAYAALVKGGHLQGAAIDVLLDEEGFVELDAERFETPHTHGTGCTYSAAITACLALGDPLRMAVARAKTYISEAIRTNPRLGRGNGPVNHHTTV